MPLTEAFRVGPDGKVIEGWTVLRDSQTGQWYDVVSVASGPLPTAIDDCEGQYGPTSIGRCAVFGGPAKWRED